jgi:hypothetical protein
MIKLKYLPLGVILLLIFSLSVYAGSEARIGTGGAQELLIPVGARGIGLHGSNIASIEGTEAIYWNPAGLAASRQTEAMFSHMNWIADINVTYLALGAKLGNAQSLGVTFKSLSFGEIDVTTTDLPDGTGESFSPQFMVIGLTYSRIMTDRINFGVSMKLVNETIRQMSASGIAFDFGVQYRNLLPGVNFGITLKSLGPDMSFNGEDIEQRVTVPGTEPGSLSRPARLVMQKFDMPVTFEMGLGYKLDFAENHSFNTFADFQNHNLGNDQYKLGVEYSFNNFLFLRGGYMQQQNDDDNIYGPTFGVGLNANIAGSQIGFDYTYRDVDYFDANQFFSVRLGF